MSSRQRQVALACAVTLSLGTAGLASPAAGAPNQGRVQFVTDRRAYLDRGASAGLVSGQRLSLYRAGRSVAVCTVEAVAQHSATCVGGRPRLGDWFGLAQSARPSEKAPAPVLAPLVDDGTLRARAHQIAEADFEKVDYAGKSAFGVGQAISASAGFGAWDPGSGSGGEYLQQRIDGALRLSLGGSGVRLDAAFSAVRWSKLPERTRFRPGVYTQFFVWQAEISRRVPGASTVVAVGRLWPWHTPGRGVLDGFQVGRQNATRTLEWGAYGGLLPDAVSLVPSTDAWAGGLYAALTQPGAKDALVRLAREEAQLGFHRVPGGGLVGDAEAVGEAWLGVVDLAAGARLRLAPDHDRQPVLELAHLQVRTPLPSTGGVTGEVRYLGQALAEDATLQEQTPALAGSYHVGITAFLDPLPWLGAGVTAGASRDLTSGLGRADGAVELRLLRLFGDAGGAWLGAEAAQGWLPSHGLYLQLRARAGSRIRVLARGSATTFMSSDAQGPADTRELGGSLHIDAALAPWLRVGGRAVLRVPMMAGAGSAAGLPRGGALSVDVAGGF
jgi:hypothetical protein